VIPARASSPAGPSSPPLRDTGGTIIKTRMRESTHSLHDRLWAGPRAARFGGNTPFASAGRFLSSPAGRRLKPPERPGDLSNDGPTLDRFAIVANPARARTARGPGYGRRGAGQSTRGRASDHRAGRDDALGASSLGPTERGTDSTLEQALQILAPEPSRVPLPALQRFAPRCSGFLRRRHAPRAVTDGTRSVPATRTESETLQGKTL